MKFYPLFLLLISASILAASDDAPIRVKPAPNGLSDAPPIFPALPGGYTPQGLPANNTPDKPATEKINPQPPNPVSPPTAPVNRLSDASELAKELINQFKLEIILNSTNWKARRQKPDFGRMRICPLKQSAELPEGRPGDWNLDSMGNPQLVLRARLMIPTQKNDGTIDYTQQAPVNFVQAVSFAKKKDQWMANASAMSVTLDEGDAETVIIPVDAGKGSWHAPLTKGGLLIEHFIEAGYAAARRPLTRRLGNAGVDAVANNQTDVLFYLRPTPLP